MNQQISLSNPHVLQQMKDRIFKYFLISKLSFKSIRHKKIVHKIFNTYLDPIKFTLIVKYLDFFVNQTQENLSYLRLLPPKQIDIKLSNSNKLDLLFPYMLQFFQIIKSWKNTQKLTINMYYCSLGKLKNQPNNYDLQNIKQIIQQIKYSKVKELEFILGFNILGKNIPLFTSIMEGISELRFSQIHDLNLNLSHNTLFHSPFHMDIFYDNLKKLLKNNKIQKLNLNLSNSYLGSRATDMEQFIKLIQQTTHIKQLQLQLSNCTFCENQHSLQLFGDIFKHLSNSKSLNKFTIDLSQNFLSEKLHNLENGLQMLMNSSSLQHLNMDLSQNNLGENPQNISILTQSLQTLKYSNTITSFDLNLQLNNLFMNNLTMKNLGSLIASFQNTQIKSLTLDLSSNLLGFQPDSFQSIGEGIGKLKNSQYLEQLELQLSQNRIGDNYQNIQKLSKGIAQLQQSQVQRIVLFMIANRLGQRSKNLDYLLYKGIKQANINKDKYIWIDIGKNEIGILQKLKHKLLLLGKQKQGYQIDF